MLRAVDCVSLQAQAVECCCGPAIPRGCLSSSSQSQLTSKTSFSVPAGHSETVWSIWNRPSTRSLAWFGTGATSVSGFAFVLAARELARQLQCLEAADPLLQGPSSFCMSFNWLILIPADILQVHLCSWGIATAANRSNTGTLAVESRFIHHSDPLCRFGEVLQFGSYDHPGAGVCGISHPVPWFMGNRCMSALTRLGPRLESGVCLAAKENASRCLSQSPWIGTWAIENCHHFCSAGVAWSSAAATMTWRRRKRFVFCSDTKLVSLSPEMVLWWDLKSAEALPPSFWDFTKRLDFCPAVSLLRWFGLVRQKQYIKTIYQNNSKQQVYSLRLLTKAKGKGFRWGLADVQWVFIAMTGMVLANAWWHLTLVAFARQVVLQVVQAAAVNWSLS